MNFPLLISILGHGLVLNFLFPYPIFSLSKCLDRLCLFVWHNRLSLRLVLFPDQNLTFPPKSGSEPSSKKVVRKRRTERPESGAVVLKSHSTPQSLTSLLEHFLHTPKQRLLVLPSHLTARSRSRGQKDPSYPVIHSLKAKYMYQNPASAFGTEG